MPKQITFTFTGDNHEDFVDEVFTWEATQNASETEDDEFVDEYADLSK